MATFVLGAGIVGSAATSDVAITSSPTLDHSPYTRFMPVCR